MLPIRIQRKRTKGWRAADAATNGLPVVSVTRPGPWGNPFTVDEEREGLLLAGHKPGVELDKKAHSLAVRKHREMLRDPHSHSVTSDVRQRFIWMREHLHELRGKNLSCYCSLDGECHRDTLIALSNE